MNRPFDAKRYKRLLEGLEVVALKFNDVIADNRVFRFDAPYFGKAALAAEAQIERGKWELLSQIADKVASFGAYALTNQFTYAEEGVPFLRCQNIHGGFADFSNVLYIDAAADKLLVKSAVEPGMVLLTMSGSVGNAAVALPGWRYPINSNQDVAKITPKESISPYYLSAFLGSRFGRVQTERFPVGSVQQHIFLWMIERLKIARLSKQLEATIAEAVAYSYGSERNAREQLEAAGVAFTAALGFSHWQPPQPLSYTRRALQAFAAGRLDAEYFSPATSAILDVLARNGDVALTKLCRVSTGYPWKSDQFIERGTGDGVAFARIRDCKPGAIWADDLDRLDARYAASQAQPRAHGGDLIVGMDGLRWFYASLLMDDVYVNQRVALLSQITAEYPAEYLLTVINSVAGQQQLLSRMTIAHTVGHITLEDIRGLRIPVLDEKMRQDIADQVRSAISDRQRAHELLAAAQRAVEIAIEQDEAAALAYLDGFGVNS